MTDLFRGALLILLLLLLGVVWISPFIRRDAIENRWYLTFKSGVYLITGLLLFTLVMINPILDLFLLLRIIAGSALLYEGTITVLKIYTDIKDTTIGGSDM